VTDNGIGSALVVANIGRLYTMDDAGSGPLGVVADAEVHARDGIVTYAGRASTAPVSDDDARRVDAGGLAVMPGLIDCHTHPVWAGSRADEFALRSRGASYAEILEAGGGILNTTKKVRAASEAELVELTRPRLQKLLARGVTTVEAKSGYGLTTDDELKSLRVLRTLDDEMPLEIVRTFLGAHAVPPEHEGDSAGYARVVADEMLPRVAEEQLASFCDVFVEKGAFSVDDGRRVLTAAQKLGLGVRIHAEQLSHTGATQLACELGAVSASHMEFANDDDIAALAEAGVVAEVLSIAQVFLGMEQRIPGRRLGDAGVPLAVATDLNPGSAHSADLHLAAGLAVSMCGLTADEALLGITRNAARALGREDIGRVAVGCRADLALLDTENAYDLVYEWGANHVARVVAGGAPVVSASR
jgi:imidazolonepropionase